MRITPISMLALLALLLAPVAAAAQPTPVLPTSQLAWDHDGVDTDGYELQVDGGDWTAVATSPGEGPGVFIAAMPSLTPGSHTLAVRACGLAGCSEGSEVLTVRLVVVPTRPGNLRVVAVE